MKKIILYTLTLIGIILLTLGVSWLLENINLEKILPRPSIIQSTIQELHLGKFKGGQNISVEGYATGLIRKTCSGFGCWRNNDTEEYAIIYEGSTKNYQTIFNYNTDFPIGEIAVRVPPRNFWEGSLLNVEPGQKYRFTLVTKCSNYFDFCLEEYKKTDEPPQTFSGPHIPLLPTLAFRLPEGSVVLKSSTVTSEVRIGSYDYVVMGTSIFSDLPDSESRCPHDVYAVKNKISGNKCNVLDNKPLTYVKQLLLRGNDQGVYFLDVRDFAFGNYSFKETSYSKELNSDLNLRIYKKDTLDPFSQEEITIWENILNQPESIVIN